MRARLEAFLNDTWYGERKPGLVLRTLESAYRKALPSCHRAEARHRAADLEGRPVIVVGNITAGGTGKTPLVIHLCELLAGRGIRVGVVSRGYGRDGSAAMLVGDDHVSHEVGDEPLLIHKRCRVPVRVGSDRAENARLLFDSGIDVVISDDGLQRRRLPRVMEICVIDGRRGFGNGRLLPAGPLREPVERLRDVDHIVYNGEPTAGVMAAGGVIMKLEPGEPVTVGDSEEKSLAELKELSAREDLHAVAGIGSPDRFFESLEQLGIRFVPHAFADHHDFTAADFEAFGGEPVLMTEKDAVKCAGLGLQRAWYLPVRALLPGEWDNAVVEAVRKMMEQGLRK